MTDLSELEITPRDAVAMLRERDDAILLDCRTHEERQVASIDDSLFVPMHELNDRLDELEPYREHSIIVYCHAGQRSQLVAHALRHHGFEGARSLTGGIQRWSEEIDSSVPRY